MQLIGYINRSKERTYPLITVFEKNRVFYIVYPTGKECYRVRSRDSDAPAAFEEIRDSPEFTPDPSSSLALIPVTSFIMSDGRIVCGSPEFVFLAMVKRIAESDNKEERLLLEQIANDAICQRKVPWGNPIYGKTSTQEKLPESL